VMSESISASFACTSWKLAIGFSNWIRLFEYWRAQSYEAIADPTAPHAIPYRASLLSMLLMAGGTAAAYAAIVGATWWRGEVDLVWVITIAVVMGIAVFASLPVLALFFNKFGVGEMKRGMKLGLVVWGLARLADSFCFAGRFYLAAAILGMDVTFGHAIILALAGNFVEMALPPGFKETIGAWLSSLTGLTIDQGMSVFVVDRLAMTAIVLVFGVIGMPFLHWNMKDGLASADEAEPLDAA